VSTAPNGSWEALIPRIVRIVQHVLELFRVRVDLAKREAQAMVRNIVMGVVYSGLAVLLLIIAVPIAIVTLVLLLATWLPPWAATGIVGLVLVLVAGGFFLAARRRFARRGRILEGFREDWRTIRDHLESRP